MHMTAKRLRGGFAAGAAAVLLGLTVAPAAHASGSSTDSSGSSRASAAGVAAGDPACGTIYTDHDFESPTWTYLGSGIFDSEWGQYNAQGTYTYNIRTGVSSACSIIGTIGNGEAINYDCYLVDAIDRTWTQLHTSSGERGWVLDDHLPDYGSHILCPKKP